MLIRSTLAVLLAVGLPISTAADDYDWRYVPFFDHPEVQACAKKRAEEWAREGVYSAAEILDEASRYNSFLPELTKTSDRDTAHLQIGAMARMWWSAKENLRPGFTLNLHEYANGLNVTCTFDAFDRHYTDG